MTLFYLNRHRIPTSVWTNYIVLCSSRPSVYDSRSMWFK